MKEMQEEGEESDTINLIFFINLLKEDRFKHSFFVGSRKEGFK